jgi:hypothetical protein
MAAKKTPASGAKKPATKSAAPKFGSPAWNAKYGIKPFAKKTSASKPKPKGKTPKSK